MSQLSLAGCAIIEDNKILLLRRIKTGWYELPGGKIEVGETAEETAMREIKEELLADIKIISQLGQKDFSENDFTMSYTWFQADLLSGQRPAIGEPEKYDDLKYIELAKLREYKLSPNMENFVAELALGNILLS
ncbi:MAG: NUDIX hydrolase [Candidatus Uhrbacteria bacterium]